MHDDTPQDIRELASQLEAIGEHERRAAGDACVRVTMRTTHLLTAPRAGERASDAGGRWQRLWLWLAAPAVAAAAVLLALQVVVPRGPTPADGAGVEVLAAGIASDIDAWMELDSMWRDDSFETNLAAISIDAAGINTQPDSLDSLPVLESGL